MHSEYHIPVMLTECLEWLVTDRSGRYVDATLGGGGHSERILEQLSDDGRLEAFDRDSDAIRSAGERLKGDGHLTIHHRPFAEMGEVLEEGKISGVLMDLGISSHQVDAPERGFSFRRSDQVDLRMDRSEELDAAEWVRRSGWEAVAKALSENADLRSVRRLAQALVASVESDGELKMSAVIAAARATSSNGRHEDAAARILQALRMEVNDELGQLTRGLDAAHALLCSGGRLVVLSYHSVEDRCVKRKGQEWMRNCTCAPELPLCLCGGDCATMRSLLKSTLRPSKTEEALNPRSRSAKLRVYEKL